MISRSRLGIALVSFILIGCAARSREAPVAPSPQAVAPFSAAMLGQGGSGLADREAFDRLFEAPEVTAAGDRLLSRLGQDPSLAPLYDEFMVGVLRQPALMETFAALAAQNPGASIDELTVEVVSRLSTSLDGPAFDAALDGSLDRLLDRPRVDAAFGRLATALVDRSHLVERLTALMMKWRPELEATVGVKMDDDRFGERLAQHLADPVREGALGRLFTERLADDPGLRIGVAALLDDEAFARASAGVVRALLTSPGVHESTTAVITGMLEDLDAEALGRRVDRVLVTTALEAAVVAWVDQMTASPVFDDLAGHLGLVLEDPNLQAELLAIVVGPSLRSTV